MPFAYFFGYGPGTPTLRILRCGEGDRAPLLDVPGIVRNRLKVDAAIANAEAVLRIQDGHGSFRSWLDFYHPLSKAEWVKLFKEIFRFTGVEITGEFLISIGYLPGAPVQGCPVSDRILELDPPWAASGQGDAR